VARALPWVIGGGAALAGFLWWRQRGTSPEANAPDLSTAVATELNGRWVWPVPYWAGRKPVISDGFNSKRPGLPRHGGVDIMYERIPTDKFAIGSSNGAPKHVMPDQIVAVAASDGVIWQADEGPTGYQVVIDHSPRPFATYYAHLEKLLVAEAKPGAKKAPVFAGAPLGFIGANPHDGEHLKHLHFEVWYGKPINKLDPEPLMKRWEIIGAPKDILVAARNAGFTYRRIGASGEPYPEWVRALKSKAGVYVIRELDGRGNAEIAYVGSSRTQLYATLTRHFQFWRRHKGFWRGQYGEGHDPGLTYERDRVEVAVRITSPSKALDEEYRLIRLLKPRDNLVGQVAADELVPF
jgi:hypothetical protein